jgi:hypothetical protein
MRNVENTTDIRSLTEIELDGVSGGFLVAIGKALSDAALQCQLEKQLGFFFDW